jgi:putative PIN family toxin of toxin-antitoxin system
VQAFAGEHLTAEVALRRRRSSHVSRRPKDGTRASFSVTNVLVSALIFPDGSPEVVYRLALSRRIELGSSRPLPAELGRVLEQKFGWQPSQAEETIAQLVRLATLVGPSGPVCDIEADPSDNRVLEAAAEPEADTIVSGDRHLLALRWWRGIPIQAPAALLALFAPEDESSLS